MQTRAANHVGSRSNAERLLFNVLLPFSVNVDLKEASKGLHFALAVLPDLPPLNSDTQIVSNRYVPTIFYVSPRHLCYKTAATARVSDRQVESNPQS